MCELGSGGVSLVNNLFNLINVGLWFNLALPLHAFLIHLSFTILSSLIVYQKVIQSLMASDFRCQWP